MQSVLVTGATGFVAGHLVPHLARAGHRVLAAGHDPARLQRFGEDRVEPVLLDVRQSAALDILPARMDAVIHLAQANVPFPEGAADLFAVHIAGTQHLLEYARKAGAQRFIFASSGSVYGGGERPWREDDPANGAGYYAASKVAAERLVQAYGSEFASTIFRLFWPFGPGQSGRVVPGLINRVRTGQTITLREGGRPRMNPLYVSHVVDVFTQALSAAGHQLVNLGGDTVLSVGEMAGTIGHILGREPVLQDLPGLSEGDIVGDITRLRQLFRLPARLTPFADGVRAMLASEA